MMFRNVSESESSETLSKFLVLVLHARARARARAGDMVVWVEFGDGLFVDENIRGKPYFSIIQIWRKLCHSVKLLTPKAKPNREKREQSFGSGFGF